jgi:hypothetical protein
LHTLQQNGRCKLCMRWCIFKWLSRSNDLLQASQTKGRSPLCSRWCFLRLQCWQNGLSHLYGLSPVCMRWWAFRWLLTLNDLLHTSQQKGGFSREIVSGWYTVWKKWEWKNKKKNLLRREICLTIKYSRRMCRNEKRG